MQRMIDICNAELDWLDMRINVNKTSCLRIGNRLNCKIANIVIDGNAISCSPEIKYLGIYILANKVFKCDPYLLKYKHQYISFPVNKR